MEDNRQDLTRVKVIRKPDLHFGPGPPEATLVEACSDRFDMEIKPDAVDNRLQRLEFAWRSPAPSLLMNPKAYIEFDVIIKSIRDMNQTTQASPGFSFFGNTALVGDAVDGPGEIAHATRRIKPAALFAFGEGDPLLAACESSTITVNGSSLTTPSPTLWSRAFLRANIRKEDAQRIYGYCGGLYDQYDGQTSKTFQRCSTHE